VYGAFPTEFFVVLPIHAANECVRRVLVRRRSDCDMWRGECLVTAVVEDGGEGDSESGTVW
jgi:hypothetical protein